MKIHLNFQNPSLVSTGLFFDVISIQVLNGSNFTSEKDKLAMNILKDGFYSTQIQPQQPSFISAEMLGKI